MRVPSWMKPTVAAKPAKCATPGCRRPAKARGHCDACHKRIVRWFPAECERCTRVLAAAAADEGYGDRNRLFRALTEAEFGAYLLGALDRLSGDRRAAEKAQAIRDGRDVKWWKDRRYLDTENPHQPQPGPS